MTPAQRRILTLGAGFLAVLLLGIIGVRAVSLSGADMCGNSVITEDSSPIHSAVVVVYERDCGATTDFSTQVALLHPGEGLPRNPPPVLFVIDSDHGRAARGPGGGPWVEAHWAGPDSVLIRYDVAARIVQQAVVIDGVRVAYVGVRRVGA